MLSAAVSLASAWNARPLAQSRKIALVAVEDDDRRRVLAESLEEQGHSVIELEDGLEVTDYLEMALEPPHPLEVPSLIVCDAQMQGRGGLELLQSLRERGQVIPVLLLDRNPGDGALLEMTERLGHATVVHSPPASGELEEALDLLA